MVKKQKKLKHFYFTFVSGWSGATPERTSPNGVGNLSMISTCASWCAFSIYSHTQQFKHRKIIKKLVINYAFLYFLSNQTYNYIHTSKYFCEGEREREIYLFSGVEASGSTSNDTNAQWMGRESWKTSGKPGPCLKDRHFRWEFELYFMQALKFRFSISNVVYT